MNGLPYYKAYPRDFIEGTIGMSFELKGAYRLVLDLIYMQGGNLPDDARYISGLLGCSIRKWNALRDELVALDKIQASAGFLTNYRAVSELETLAKLQDKQRENASGPRKNKGLEKPPFRHTEPEPEPDLRVGSYEPTARVRAPSASQHLAPVIGDELARAFVAHRTAMKAPMTPHAGKLMAAKLAAMPDPAAAVTLSIERGWKGVFEPDPVKIHSIQHKRQSDGERLDDQLDALKARLAYQRL